MTDHLMQLLPKLSSVQEVGRTGLMAALWCHSVSSQGWVLWGGSPEFNGADFFLIFSPHRELYEVSLSHVFLAGKWIFLDCFPYCFSVVASKYKYLLLIVCWYSQWEHKSFACTDPYSGSEVTRWRSRFSRNLQGSYKQLCMVPGSWLICHTDCKTQQLNRYDKTSPPFLALCPTFIPSCNTKELKTGCAWQLPNLPTDFSKGGHVGTFQLSKSIDKGTLVNSAAAVFTAWMLLQSSVVCYQTQQQGMYHCLTSFGSQANALVPLKATDALR